MEPQEGEDPVPRPLCSGEAMTETFDSSFHGESVAAPDGPCDQSVDRYSDGRIARMARGSASHAGGPSENFLAKERRQVIRGNAFLEPRRKLRHGFGLVSQGARWLLLVSLALSGVVACEPGSLGESPSPDCRESGVQCQLPAGPLGVCERSTCNSGETPPCFQCTPQH